MENQYFITKDENGNFVIASRQCDPNNLKKMCTISCSSNAPLAQKNIKSPFKDPSTGRLTPLAIGGIIFLIIAVIAFIYFQFFDHPRRIRTSDVYRILGDRNNNLYENMNRNLLNRRRY